jgi:hypothetical protein
MPDATSAIAMSPPGALGSQTLHLGSVLGVAYLLIEHRLGRRSRRLAHRDAAWAAGVPMTSATAAAVARRWAVRHILSLLCRPIARCDRIEATVPSVGQRAVESGRKPVRSPRTPPSFRLVRW